MLGIGFLPRKMIDHAWEWAEKRGKKRKNAVHGEEEICFVLDDGFLLRDEHGQSLGMEGSFQLEARFQLLTCLCIRLQPSVHILSLPLFSFLRRTLMQTCWMGLGLTPPPQVMLRPLLCATRHARKSCLPRMKQLGLDRHRSSFLVIMEN